ncbi:uncharacterized protein B0H18DRAFT_1119841 [Fomitopsis serialis]|uniref:uncharacterized protein n=1 Tax=Fomitopsis serialis TaxID=139415 RepID=UPI0020078327|nr:uncharacterized protein B0H18DRAFT_1119841 [Neoantrodia serialis]KAH9924495.1 hypothetical protein B0H18DRAFT_1119841 [Neoantrodia serialis]
MPAPAQNLPQPEVQYVGFYRANVGKSAVHKAKLEEDGFVYCGYLNTQDYSHFPPPPAPKVKTSTQKRVVIDLVSDSEDEAGKPTSSTTTSLSSKPSSSSTTSSSTAKELTTTGPRKRSNGSRKRSKSTQCLPQKQALKEGVRRSLRLRS